MKIMRHICLLVIFTLLLSMASSLALTDKVKANDNYLNLTGGVLLWDYLVPGDDPWVQAEIVDDLDGDGYLDVLITTHVGLWTDRTANLTAVCGIDGSPLWQVSVSGQYADVYAEAAGDLDGDDKTDVLVRTTVGRTPAESILMAKKGTNGTDIWAPANQPTITGQDAAVIFFPVDDFDGDDLADVLLYTRIYSSPDEFTVMAKKGTNGDTLWDLDTFEASYISMNLRLVDDLDGDNLTDVLLEIQEGTTGTFTIKALSGYDGSLLWDDSTYGTNPQGGAQAIDDLNGDSLTDVIVYLKHGGFSPSYEDESYFKAVIGTNGVEIWSDNVTDPVQAYHPDIVDDLDGDGKQDVLVPTQEGNTYSLRAYSGDGGLSGPEILWEETISGSEVSLDWDVVDDLDSDGQADVLVTKTQGPWDGERENIITARKGSDGSALWSANISGLRADAYPVPIDDINDDGKTDVILASSVGPSESANATLMAKQGSDGTILWTDNISGENVSFQPEGIDDLDGDGMAEVMVFSEIGPWANMTKKLTMKSGIDGTMLWEVSVNGSYPDTWSYQLGDLSCDNESDILFGTAVGSSEDRVWNSIALQGWDGTQLWEVESNSELHRANWSNDPEGWITYDLNGDGKTDVVVFNRGKVSAISAVPCVTAYNLTLSADPIDIPADGVSTSNITATVTDQLGFPVLDPVDVTFSTENGTLLGPTTVQTVNGVATIELQSEYSSDGIIVATINATAMGESAATAVFFISGHGAVKDSYTEIIDGSGTLSDPIEGIDVSINGTGEHIVTVAEYQGNPHEETVFKATGSFYDVHLNDDEGVENISISFCPATSHTKIYYWDGSKWNEVGDQSYEDGCVIVNVSSDTEPNLEDLAGLVFVPGIDFIIDDLYPNIAFNPVGTQHTINAIIEPAMPSANISFVVSGNNTSSGWSLTDVNGEASYSYIGTHAGADNITAYFDSNGNGSFDEGEPSHSATKYWLENFVTGGGKINSSEGKGKKAAATFGGTVGVIEGVGIVGQFQIVDHESDKTVSWHCHNDFENLCFEGEPAESPEASHDTAIFLGHFTNNRNDAVMDMWIKIVDNGEGKKAPTDEIGLSLDGVSFLMTAIDGGNFQVHNLPND